MPAHSARCAQPKFGVLCARLVPLLPGIAFGTDTAYRFGTDNDKVLPSTRLSDLKCVAGMVGNDPCHREEIRERHTKDASCSRRRVWYRCAIADPLDQVICYADDALVQQNIVTQTWRYDHR